MLNLSLNIKITKPNEFTLVPWKNGLGHTTELAISDGGNLDNFDWRLSIASVLNDGDFSNFAGYQRNLVLIEGNGLTLDHRNGKVDKLTQLLDIARFDGVSKTHGALVDGGIKDFNVITKTGAVIPNVQCYRELKKVTIKLTKASLCFAYSLTDDIALQTMAAEKTLAPVGCLVEISVRNNKVEDDPLTISLTGKNMIIIQLNLI
jgi:environmental stress-induced protein Ves